MDPAPVFVLDASVGVKWFKEEFGSDVARSLYARAVEGGIRLAAPTHFVHEVLAIVQRQMSARAIPEAWEHLKASGITIVPLTDEIVEEAAAQCDSLGCSFYDALAPACASLLGATLASADTRAHGAYPDLHLVESAE